MMFKTKKNQPIYWQKKQTKIGFEFSKINSLNDFDKSCIYQSFTAV